MHRRTHLVVALVAGLLAAPFTAVADDLPDADTLLKNSIEAMGGRKAIDAIETLQLESTMSVFGQQLNSTAYWTKTGACVVKRVVPQQGEIEQGTDGKKLGWTKMGPAGYTLLAEEEVDTVVDQGVIHARVLTLDKRAKKDFTSYETVGQTTFGGKECYQVHIATKDAGEGDLYFDVKTGLLVGFSRTNNGQMAKMVVSDWKPIEGVKFFMKTSVEGGGMMMDTIFGDIKVNKTEASVFKVPEQVVKLAENRPAEDPELKSFSAQERTQIRAMLTQLNATRDAVQLQTQITNMESGLGFVPAEQKKIFEYVIKKAKERLEELKAGG